MVRFRRLDILRITLIKINPIVLVIENYVMLSVFKWHVTLANPSKIIIVIRNRIIIEFYSTVCRLILFPMRHKEIVVIFLSNKNQANFLDNVTII